ncbi:MAG: hypothetical protein ACSLE0_07010 [Chitinophagaceae bacterium]
MKKTLFVALVACLVITTTQAQEVKDSKPGKHHMMKKHHRGEEFKNLDLSEDQKARIKSLNEENHKQMAELKKNDNVTVKEWKAKMEAQRKDHHAKIQSVLTPDQQAQIKKSRQEKNVRNQDRSKARMEKMKTDLGLSEKQSAQLESSRMAMVEKMKTIREDGSINDEQKKEKAKELKTKHKEDLKSILTDEQQKKWDEQRQKHSSHKKNV